jgi:hypothetical protein
MRPAAVLPRELALALALVAVSACAEPRAGDRAGSGPSPAVESAVADARGSDALSAGAGMPPPAGAIPGDAGPSVPPAGSSDAPTGPGPTSGAGDAAVDAPAADVLAPREQPRIVWDQQVGSVSAVAVSGDSVYVTGSFVSGDRFDDMPLPAAVEMDMFLAKLDSAGKPLWVRPAAGPGGQAGIAVAVAPDGAVAVTGTSDGPRVTMAGQTLDKGEGFSFQALFSPDGQLRRLQADAGSTFLAFDGEGNLITFTTERWLTKLDRAGSPLWPKLYPELTPQAVAIDGRGNVLVCDELESPITVAGTSHRPIGSRDALVVKISPIGTMLWARSLGGAGVDGCTGIATGFADDVLFAGNFQDGLQLPDGLRPSKGKTDGFFAKLGGADGRLLWIQTFGDTGADETRSIATDGKGDVLVGAWIMYPLDLGGRSLEPGPAGSVLLKHAGSSGAHLAGYPLNNGVVGLAPHASGDFLVAGGSVLRLQRP